MNEKKNKEIYKELSELVSITIKAIKDSHHSDESKTMALQMLQKAQVPVLWGGGGRKQIPLGHVFKKEFEETGLTLTEAYSSLHLPKNAEEKNIFDEDGMMPGDDKIHPSHYQSYNPNLKIECIDAMRAAFGDEEVAIFCKLNAFKYNWRALSKGGNTDIGKAIWYLDKFLELGGCNNE